MKKFHKVLLAAAVVTIPMFAVAQINDGGFGSTFGTIGTNDFAVDTFVRQTVDYRNATYHGGGLWSNTDVVIGVGTRIRPWDDQVTLSEMLRGWRDLENQERLAQMIKDLENHQGPEDCTNEIGLIDFIRDVLHQIAFQRYGSQTGGNRFEWGAMLVTDDGNVRILNDGIYTDGDREEVGHNITGLDLSTLVSVVHNHPEQGRSRDSINLQNRYPSQLDWQSAGNLVARGADPNVLTLTVIGPDGEARVFAHSSNATYRNLSDSQQNAGRNLPDGVPDNTVMRDGKCVTL